MKKICEEKGVSSKCRLQVPGRTTTFLEEMLSKRISEMPYNILIPNGASRDFSDVENTIEQTLPPHNGDSLDQLRYSLEGFELRNETTHLITVPTDLYIPNLDLYKFIETYKKLTADEKEIGCHLVGSQDIGIAGDFSTLRDDLSDFQTTGIYILPKEEIHRITEVISRMPIIYNVQIGTITDGGCPKTFNN